ncbi:P-loop containing nucleoside triphosphate hydrolase protein [Viridothelium virens]|uniref:DNA 3'-5' helicase n=1 Tax=Viridothelium virens TaxID=1048519 RepID=A0A6A6HM68_VIRVR|nr:P-loop containing nucleoside triphosphate hydrolase protein [Viridothelium virens]
MEDSVFDMLDAMEAQDDGICSPSNGPIAVRRHHYMGSDCDPALLHSSINNQTINQGRPAVRAEQMPLDAFESAAEPKRLRSSSPGVYQTPSSPAFKAGQRRHAQRGQEVRSDNDHELNADDHMELLGTATISEHPFRPEYIGSKITTRQNPTTSQRTPVVRGINLIATTDLPDRFRPIFPFRLLNAIQSKCFDTIFHSNDNFVLASPTGSGKTVVFELAICRVIASFPSDNFKVVYQAPTKSLCAERQKDWQAKFGPLGAICVEITGDTDQTQMKRIGGASIIVTTPEKWDSMTRKWKDHQRLMQLVRLFLIDEVHIVKENRGATLEAVVSRMKTATDNVRFIALSATVPNSDDVAKWLGRGSNHPELPAARETFGEDFRPVELKKYVAGFPSNGNDFQFDKHLDGKLTDLIAKHTQRKPIMVFCSTRKSTETTAGLLSNWWSAQNLRERCWISPRKPITVEDAGLQACVPASVAFHHAGLHQSDRHAVEKAFLDGEIYVICCTSTLAVGVNLPCHFVIIKNTVTYQNQNGLGREYSDLEIMQMLGRAGRPQFDDSAVAVIMTRSERAQHFEKMVSGQEILESCLHVNLIEHLNAEIGLGTIHDIDTARTWLRGTFLHVRLPKNPDHYRLEGDTKDRFNLDGHIERILNKNIDSLLEHELIQSSPKLQCSKYGDAMARYYVQFETMKFIIGLPAKARISEILSAIAQAVEFQEIRFRSGEKPIYKEINQSTSTKFPIPVDLAMRAHKVSLIIQAVLGSIEFPGNHSQPKMRLQHQTEQAIVFQHVHRLIRCIIDCQLSRGDSTGSRNALMLARSLAARAWDDSPLQLKQLEKIGIVAVRKLVAAGVRTIEELETAEAQRIETILGRAPPFGIRLLDHVKAFPKLRVSVQMQGQPKRKPDGSVIVNIRAEIGFINETPPAKFNNRDIYVCFLAETSDGRKMHFCRIKASRLTKDFEIPFSATLTNSSQTVACYVMCDEVGKSAPSQAGTMRHVLLNLGISPQMFPFQGVPEVAQRPESRRKTRMERPNTSKPRSRNGLDEFGDGDIADSDLIQAAAANSDFVHIDKLEQQHHSQERSAPTTGSKRRKIDQGRPATHFQQNPPARLDNGRWPCKHRCKDKMVCKHLCCREGLDAPPKVSKAEIAHKASSTHEDLDQRSKQHTITRSFPRQANSSQPAPAPTERSTVEDIDLTGNSGNGQKHHSHVQLLDHDREAQVMNIDSRTTPEDDSSLFQELDNLPHLPPAASPKQSSLFAAGNEPEPGEDAIPLSNLEQQVSPQEPDLETLSGRGNWLFHGDSSTPATVQGSMPELKSPEHIQSNTRSTQGLDATGNVPFARDLEQPSPSDLTASKAVPELASHANAEDEKPPDRFEGIEAWVREEFGDIIELV